MDESDSSWTTRCPRTPALAVRSLAVLVLAASAGCFDGDVRLTFRNGCNRPVSVTVLVDGAVVWDDEVFNFEVRTIEVPRGHEVEISWHANDFSSSGHVGPAPAVADEEFVVCESTRGAPRGPVGQSPGGGR